MAYSCPEKGCGMVIERREGITKHRALHALPEKTCNKCRLTLPITEFRIVRVPHQNRWHYRPTCHPCDRAWEKARREKNGAWHGAHLLRKFGITLERYHEMKAAQGGGCAICGKDETRPIGKGVRAKAPMYLAVDHDHETGEVRGLLCGHCNMGLGHFRDSSALLTKAALYLERPLGTVTDEEVSPSLLTL